MNERQPRRYRFAGRDLTGWILGLTGAQCLTLGIAVVTAGLVLDGGAPAPLALLPLIGGAALAFARISGMPLWDWLPGHAALALRRALRLTGWKADLAVSSASAAPRATAQPQLPPSFGRITLTHVPVPGWCRRQGAGVGVVEDCMDGTVTATLRVRGRAFPLEDEGEQDRLVAGWGEALSAFCAEASSIAWVRWSEWAAPADLDAHIAHLEQHRAVPPDDPAVVAYRELLDLAASTASAHETLVSVTVDSRHLPLRRGRPSRRNRAAARSETVEVLLEELRLLGLRLEAAGLAVDPPLSVAELATAVRLRLNPICRSDLAVRGRSLAAQAGLVSIHNAGPMSTVEHRRYFEADTSLHRCFQIAEWPRRDVSAGWMEPLLLEGAGVRTVSFTCYPVPPSRSARHVNRDATRLVTDAELRERKGFRVGAVHRRAQAAVAEREEELTAGHGDVEYLGLVAVTASDPAALEAACAEYRQLAARAGLELRALDANHDLAVAAVLPLGRPLAVRRLG